MFAGLRRAWRAFWLTPLPDRATPPLPAHRTQHMNCLFPDCDCHTREQCKFDAPSPPPFLRKRKCDCTVPSYDGYCDGQCGRDNMIFNVKDDKVPTQLPPPPPERPPLEDAIADCFEIGAREIETNIRTLHSAYAIALSEGLALASEFRLRGELERLRTRNSMELAKALVINFRERSAELRGDKPPAVSSAA